MRFEEFERVEYKHNILFEVLFQARFPEILKISQEIPVEFQDIIRKEGYPELVSDIPLLPSDMPKELKEAVSTAKVFRFFSKEKDWEVSLTQNFIALTCHGNYKNYEDYRERLEKVLRIFDNVYEPSYFTRIGIRHKNIANKVLFPNAEQKIETFIPEHIFPELAKPIVEDIESLQKKSQFNDGNTKATVLHIWAQISGKFGQKQLTNEKAYIIDIDCFSENKTEGIKNVLNICDTFKRVNWDIFQWSITEDLRDAMGRTKS